MLADWLAILHKKPAGTPLEIIGEEAPTPMKAKSRRLCNSDWSIQRRPSSPSGMG